MSGAYRSSNAAAKAAHSGRRRRQVGEDGVRHRRAAAAAAAAAADDRVRRRVARVGVPVRAALAPSGRRRRRRPWRWRRHPPRNVGRHARGERGEQLLRRQQVVVEADDHLVRGRRRRRLGHVHARVERDEVEVAEPAEEVPAPAAIDGGVDRRRGVERARRAVLDHLRAAALAAPCLRSSRARSAGCARAYGGMTTEIRRRGRGGRRERVRQHFAPPLSQEARGCSRPREPPTAARRPLAGAALAGAGGLTNMSMRLCHDGRECGGRRRILAAPTLRRSAPRPYGRSSRGSAIMWSPVYGKDWGCRCCKGGGSGGQPKISGRCIALSGGAWAEPCQRAIGRRMSAKRADKLARCVEGAPSGATPASRCTLATSQQCSMRTSAPRC